MIGLFGFILVSILNLSFVDSVKISRADDLQAAIIRAGKQGQNLDMVADMLSGDVQELEALLREDPDFEGSGHEQLYPRTSVLMTGRGVSGADPKDDKDSKEKEAEKSQDKEAKPEEAKSHESKPTPVEEMTGLEKGLTLNGAVSQGIGIAIYSVAFIILITCFFSSCFRRRKDDLPTDQNDDEDELHEVWVLSSDSSGKAGRTR